MKKVMIIQPMTGKTYEQLKTEWDTLDNLMYRKPAAGEAEEHDRVKHM